MLAGVVLNLRGGRPILSAMYAVALVEYVVLLPYLTVHLSLH